MKISEAIEAIKEKLTAARAGRIATVGVISVYGPVVYAELDNNGRLCPVRHHNLDDHARCAHGRVIDG